MNNVTKNDVLDTSISGTIAFSVGYVVGRVCKVNEFALGAILGLAAVANIAFDALNRHYNSGKARTYFLVNAIGATLVGALEIMALKHFGIIGDKGSAVLGALVGVTAGISILNAMTSRNDESMRFFQ